MTKVILHTTMGDITLKMNDDMPITTGNFIKLAEDGFYDGIIFHRVIKDFMIQGGCPEGTGMGGPGYTIDDEFGTGHSNKRGTIAMANTGRPHSGGSQFFINTVDNGYLDKENPTTPYAHPVFGEVIEGMDVVDRIGNVRTDFNDKPVEPVTIIEAEVIEMSKHVMECLGMSRVTIEDGRVTDVTEPIVKRCPLFEKHRGIKELNKDSIKENIEYRIKTFGMCCENRETTMRDFLSFGISETLSTALRDGEVDAVVLAADGCGTAVVTCPEVVQGLGGRISGIRETEPLSVVIDAVGRENVLDPDRTPIDMISGADMAFGKGFDRIAVTTASVQDAMVIKERYGDRAIIALVHTTCLSDEDCDTAFEVCDIITACASKRLREIAKGTPGTLIAGSAVPVYGVTESGKRLVQRRLDMVGKKAWEPGQPEDPPFPLI